MACDAVRRAETSRIANEAGFSLLESLIAILIFAVGALAMVGMFGRAIITTARDAQFRTEAAVYATDLLHAIAAGVERDPLSGDVIVSGTVNSLDKFARNPNGNLCAYTGGAAPHPIVTAWENKIRAAGAGLPW